jgi:hypothetical protein
MRKVERIEMLSFQHRPQPWLECAGGAAVVRILELRLRFSTYDLPSTLERSAFTLVKHGPESKGHPFVHVDLPHCGAG